MVATFALVIFANNNIVWALVEVAGAFVVAFVDVIPVVAETVIVLVIVFVAVIVFISCVAIQVAE